MSRTSNTSRARLVGLRAIVASGRMSHATVSFGEGNEIVRCFSSKTTIPNVVRSCKAALNNVRKIVFQPHGEEPRVVWSKRRA